MSATLQQIIPFIRPLEQVILDPAVTEIMVNEGGRRVFLERHGLIEETGITLEPKMLTTAIQRIARLNDDEAADDQPLLDARLADGSRISAMLPPVAVDGAQMTIRKFGERFSLPKLIAFGSLTPAVAELLVGTIAAKRNLLISGGTGTGKTTLLNAVADTIPPRDRIVLIEQTSEILIQKPNLVRCEAKRKQQTSAAVTITDLVVAALRFRPDRIILGEVRGGEAWDLLQALNTGHRGSMSTIHGNTATEALTRLAHCVLMSGVQLPYAAIQQAIALAIQVVVHIDRTEGQRRVTQVLAVEGYDAAADRFRVVPLYDIHAELAIK